MFRGRHPLNRASRRPAVGLNRPGPPQSALLAALLTLVAVTGQWSSVAGQTQPPGGTVLIVEPQDGVKGVVRQINLAQRTIFVEMYILTDRRIVRALERAAAQGVDVYVMLDPRAFGMGSQPERESELLRAAGIAVRWARPAFALTHAKMLVLDDRLAIISTANMSRSAFTANREFLLLDTNAMDVRELSAVFRADWDRLPVRTPDPRLVIAPINARPVLERLIRSARRSIVVYAEEIGDTRVEALLVTAARYRVSVRVILAAGQTPAAASYLDRHGVSVRELGTPYIHAKAIVVDGARAYVGSENLSTQSLDRNREVGILEGRAVASTIQGVFARDWRQARAIRR